MQSLKQQIQQHTTTAPTRPPPALLHSSTHSRRAVLQGGFSAAAAVLVQLSAAGGSQARQEPKPDGGDVAESPFVQELLKRSQEMKEQRDKERLDAYYKKNFKDYFEFEAGNARAGAARGVRSETQAAIDRWLQANQ